MIDDYRRGRAAIAYLARRRPMGEPLLSRRDAGKRFWLAGSVAALILAVWLIGRDATPAGELSPDQPIAGINGPADGVVPPERVVHDRGNTVLPVIELRYGTWGEAAAKVSFPLREPRWLPEGYWLSALQSFVPDVGEDKDRSVDSVVATYTGSGRDHIVFDQFRVARPDEFDIASTLPHPPTREDVIEVANRKALWQAGSDPSNLVLVWQDEQVGYRLEGVGVDLASLIRVAASLYE